MIVATAHPSLWPAIIAAVASVVCACIVLAGVVRSKSADDLRDEIIQQVQKIVRDEVSRAETRLGDIIRDNRRHPHA